MIFLSPCLDTALRLQAIGRCQRMGQRRPVTCTTLALSGTVEEKALVLMNEVSMPVRQCSRTRATISDQRALRWAALEEMARL